MIDSRNVVPGSMYGPIPIRARMDQGAVTADVVHMPMLRNSRLVDIVVGYGGAAAATADSPIVRIKNSGGDSLCEFIVPTTLSAGQHYSLIRDQPSWLTWVTAYESPASREIALGETLTYTHGGGGGWAGYYNIFLVVVPVGLAPYQYSS